MVTSGDNKRPDIKISTIIRRKYVALRLLGKGGYGVVFEIMRISSPETRYAIKTELATIHNNLKSEWEIMNLLQKKNAKHCIIGVEYGAERNFNYIIMHLVGPSLSDIRRNLPPRKFSLYTTSVVALQCFDALHDLHDQGYIHRDIKPSNYAVGLLGTEKEKIVHLLDFGICRKIFVMSDGECVLRKPRMKVPFRGTVQYCSLNVHLRLEPGRHDDFWSLLYMSIELLLGDLPWEKMLKEDTKKYKENRIDELLDKCPLEFQLFRTQLQTLSYSRDPDYDKLRNILIHLIQTNHFSLDKQLDWQLGEYGLLFANRVKMPSKTQTPINLADILNIPKNPVTIDLDPNIESVDVPHDQSTSKSDDTLVDDEMLKAMPKTSTRRPSPKFIKKKPGDISVLEKIPGALQPVKTPLRKPAPKRKSKKSAKILYENEVYDIRKHYARGCSPIIPARRRLHPTTRREEGEVGRRKGGACLEEDEPAAAILLLFRLIAADFDNSVIGQPYISCEKDRIVVDVITERPFTGKVFVKGEYGNSQCTRLFRNGEHVSVDEFGNQVFQGTVTRSRMGTLEEQLRSATGDSRIAHGKINVPDDIADEYGGANQGKAGALLSGSSNTGIEGDQWTTAGGATPDMRAAFGGSRGEEKIVSTKQNNLTVFEKTKNIERGLYGNVESKNHIGSSQMSGSASCPPCEPCRCDERRSRRATNSIRLEVGLDTCNSKRDRKLNPPSLVVSFVAVVSFHDSFITKLDKAYHIQCAYAESEKTVSTDLNVTMTDEVTINGTIDAPSCEYLITDEKSVPVRNTFVGDLVKHQWVCRGGMTGKMRMLVHDCFIEDGSSQNFMVIDENGCSLDQYMLQTPTYSSDGLTANVDAYVFRFPERSGVDFKCSISFCSIDDHECDNITPPRCHSNHLRRKRSANPKMPSLSLHSNSLTVFDVDTSNNHQDFHISAPQSLSSIDDSPTSFCLSITSFGVLCGKLHRIRKCLINVPKNEITIIDLAVCSTTRFFRQIAFDLRVRDAQQCFEISIVSGASENIHIGVGIIWFTIGTSILFDIVTIAILFKEIDRTSMLIRMLPYAAIECGASVLTIILYILSASLAISSEEITADFSFITAALVCVLIAAIYVINFGIYLRKWLNNTHHRNPSDVYEYTNYGNE
ncbi:unnamed protein product [Caenorhabditis bovis]|uniref:Protein kinase domain-containing protein n=1 Tax=Caenorhabditis bovis TaxID=2654633 RepID=A0A8S1FAR8_9PELO|nr:unnamed protein product [Caenorhabditis bovis]